MSNCKVCKREFPHHWHVWGVKKCPLCARYDRRIMPTKPVEMYMPGNPEADEEGMITVRVVG